jgi:hypothetical protein
MAGRSSSILNIVSSQGDGAWVSSIIELSLEEFDESEGKSFSVIKALSWALEDS